MLNRLPRALAAAFILALALTAVAVAAKPKSGTYEGKVAAGYMERPQFTLTVKRGRVQDVVARMFYRCNNGPQEQTVVAPSRPYKIKKSGKFSGESTESIGGVASETVWISGKFKGGKVTGKIRSQTVGGGETCDTLERKFSATRK